MTNILGGIRVSLSSPWDLIEVIALRKNEQVQPTNKRIHIIYVLEGSVTIKYMDEETRLKTKGYYILESSKIYNISQVLGNIFLLSFEYDNGLFKKQNHYYVFSGNSEVNSSPVELELGTKMNNILKLFAVQQKHTHAYVYEAYFGTIALLEKCFRHKRSKKNFEQNLKNRINEIKFYIDTNFSKEISLSELASIFYVSEPYLSKIFKMEVGTSFSQYLQQRRLIGVKTDLVSTNESVTTIALNHGFSNINSFNKLFKMNVGMTPTEYRKEITTNDLIETPNTTTHNNIHQTLTTHFAMIDNQVEENQKLISNSVDVHHTGIFNHSWKQIINLGYATDILQTNVEQQIQTMQRDIPFYYGRIWGIFSDGLIMENRINGKVRYNFGKVDKIIQILLKNNLKPFLDFGIKPKMVIDQEYHVKSYRFSYKKRSIEEWGNIVKEFIAHCVNEFGYDEVSQWYFELWRPSKKVFESIGILESTNQVLFENEVFLQYFTVFYQTIKDVAPDAKVGGGGIGLDMEIENIDELLQMWLPSQCVPDFLTFTIFQMDYSNQHFSDTKLSADENYIFRKLRDNYQILNSLQTQVEVIVAEFNCSLSNREPLNDSLFKASYIVKCYLDNFKYKVKMGYWLLTDIFSYAEDAKQLLFGGAGLISMDGIKKPSYFAFGFLNALGNLLIEQGKGYIITKNVGQRFQILFYHYSHLGAEIYYSNRLDNYAQLSQAEKITDLYFKLELVGLKNGNYKIKTRRINRNFGSIIDKLSDFEKKNNLKEQEISYHRSTCLPSMEIKELLVEEEKMLIREVVSEQEVVLIEIDLIY
jgi:xylan 1,4-beta-xylosidase